MSVIGFANGESTYFLFNYNKLPIFNKFLEKIVFVKFDEWQSGFPSICSRIIR